MNSANYSPAQMAALQAQQGGSNAVPLQPQFMPPGQLGAPQDPVFPTSPGPVGMPQLGGSGGMQAMGGPPSMGGNVESAPIGGDPGAAYMQNPYLQPPMDLMGQMGPQGPQQGGPPGGLQPLPPMTPPNMNVGAGGGPPPAMLAEMLRRGR